MTITANVARLSRDTIVNSAVDLFGYAYSDFDGMTSDEILVYLDNDDGAVDDILEYNYLEGIVPNEACPWKSVDDCEQIFKNACEHCPKSRQTVMPTPPIDPRD